MALTGAILERSPLRIILTILSLLTHGVVESYGYSSLATTFKPYSEQCQVYAQGQVKASLPTVVSVSTLSWENLSLLFVSLHKTLACVSIHKTKTGIISSLHHGDCRNYNKISTKPSSIPAWKDWMHVNTEQSDAILIHFLVLNFSRKLFNIKFLDLRNMWVIVKGDESLQTKFNCLSNCVVSVIPSKSHLNLFKQYDKSSVSFNILPN